MNNKLKRHVVFFTLLIISVVFLVGMGEAAKIKLRVKISKADVRLRADAGSMVIAQVPLGAILDSEGKTGEWFIVKLPADKKGFIVSGYVHESLVDVEGGIEEVPVERKYEREKPVEVGRVYQTREVLMRAKTSGLTGKGLKVGLNMANLTGDDAKIGNLDKKSQMGICVGGFITYSINEMFAIQPEVLYSATGARAKEEVQGNILKAWMKFSYLQIPVLAKVTIPSQGNLKPSIFAGPYFALKLSAKGGYKWGAESDTEDIDEAKGTDFGLVFGGGVDIGGLGFLGKGKMTVDIRYNLGLTSIIEDEDVKNAVFTILVGFSF